MTEFLLHSIVSLYNEAERFHAPALPFSDREPVVPTPDVITTDTYYFGPMVLIALGLVIGVKVGGTVLFWLFSYILGNKLTDLLQENDQPAASSRPPFAKRPPRPGFPSHTTTPGNPGRRHRHPKESSS